MRRMTLKKALRVYAQNLRAKYRSEYCLGGRKMSIRQERESLEMVAEATNSSTKAVLSWARGQTKPAGEAELRLMCHLERRGFQIIEIENLNSDVREVLWEISLNTVSVELAMRKLGFKKQSDFFKVLRGTSVPSPDQLQLFAAFIQKVDIVGRLVEANYITLLKGYLDGDESLEDFEAPSGVASRRDLRRERLRREKVIKETE